MLWGAVRDFIRRIEGLDEAQAVPVLAAHLLAVNPQACAETAGTLGARAERSVPPEDAATTLARGQYGFLKTIPDFVRRVQEVVRLRTAPPATTLALAGVLAYLAKPGNVVRDDLPGGAGLLDDGIVIYSVGARMLPFLRQPHVGADDLETAVSSFALGIPPELMPAVQAQVEAVWRSYHQLEQTPPFLVDRVLDDLLDEPAVLSAILARYTAEFQPPPPAPVIRRCAPEELLSRTGSQGA